MPEKVIVYGHPACFMIPPVIGLLKRSKVDYQYINIHADLEARQQVREINKGYESVPTVMFPDGSTLTEPSTKELQTQLESLGYHVPLTARLIGNIFPISLGIIIFLLALRLVGVF